MMPVPYHGCTCHLRYAAAKEHAAVVASNKKQVSPFPGFQHHQSNVKYQLENKTPDVSIVAVAFLGVKSQL
jgi:hypothetical protein